MRSRSYTIEVLTIIPRSPFDNDTLGVYPVYQEKRSYNQKDRSDDDNQLAVCFRIVKVRLYTSRWLQSWEIVEIREGDVSWQAKLCLTTLEAVENHDLGTEL